VDRADIAQSANTLDTVEVRARSGPSICDAVSILPGVRNISTGEAGGVPMIRGQTNERIRILTNGFPHDYYQFSRRHMPNVDTYDCDSIEIIRGPASVLYGTQAMGEWNISTSISRNTRRVLPNGRAQSAEVNLKLLTQTFRASLQHNSVANTERGWICT
jgi:outer membrane receptor for ferrienterochelin and colicin